MFTPTPTFIPIATVTAPENIERIVFDNIPQTYTDLVITFSGRSSGTGTGDALRLWINQENNYSTNFSQNRLFGGTALGGNFSTSAGQIDIIRLNTSASSNTEPGYSEIHIFNYAVSDKHKVIYGYSATNTTEGSAMVNHGTSVWRNTTEAINRIELNSFQGGNFSSGTVATLYGIERA
jgi:hypothetical protein